MPLFRPLAALSVSFAFFLPPQLRATSLNPLHNGFDPHQAGYVVDLTAQTVRFIYHLPTWRAADPFSEGIYVAGSFNGWQLAIGNPAWRMQPAKRAEIYELVKPLSALNALNPRSPAEFKFVTGRGVWQEPHHLPPRYRRGVNLWIDLTPFRSFAECAGYDFSNGVHFVRFLCDPTAFATTLATSDVVYVVGSFNNWGASIGNPAWRMLPLPDHRTYVLLTNTAAVNVPGPSGYPEFRFVTEANYWLPLDFTPLEFVRNNNLWLNLDLYGDITPPRPLHALVISSNQIRVQFSEPLSQPSVSPTNFALPRRSILTATLTDNPSIVELSCSPFDFAATHYQLNERLSVAHVADANGIPLTTNLSLPLTLDRPLLEAFFNSIPTSTQTLGVVVTPTAVFFRLFGPRLQSADLIFFDGPTSINPLVIKHMSRDHEFIWSCTVPTNVAYHGAFYKFRICRDGHSSLISDPYAHANFHSSGNSIVIWPDHNDPPFTGWTDHNFVTPPIDQLIIYETHIANISGRNPVVSNMPWRYNALTNAQPGSPLHHLKRLGVNAIEFMPLHEFDNGSSLDFQRHYHWGYMSSLFLAPESSFSTDPAARRHVSELKNLINTLHAHGFAVIVDVVYNHTANENNYLGLIDFEYFFTGRNDSGCGNTTYASRPMMRKLIVDSLCHLVSTYHVDGFRFDLSHLLDQTGLFTPEHMARVQRAKPTKGNVIWIAESWSYDRADLKGRGVAQWNDWFREDIKAFVARAERRDSIPQRVMASRDRNAYATPCETINYVESHDENTIGWRLLDAGITNPIQQLHRAQMAALILFTSHGVPMLWEGQEMLRINPAQVHDYDRNMLDWQLLMRHAQLFHFYRRLINLRKRFPVLRSPRHEPPAFFEFIYPPHPHALGYILNADDSYPTQPRFLILLNPGSTPATFTLRSGSWMLLADERGFLPKPEPRQGAVVVPSGCGWLLSQPAHKR
ncbi:MAG: alpha-amylase family glycosyl hydrolase [bacterium]|nr:alpha-amylase family glycosyl hydrolase [bacterium]